MPAPITFVIPGSEVADETRGGPGKPRDRRIKHHIKPRAERAGGEVTRVVAVPGEDIVEIEIANGPTLTLHPETARDLMLSQSQARLPRSAATATEVEVPVNLRWHGLEEAAAARGATRGLFGDVLLDGFKVLIGQAAEPAKDIV